MFRKDEEARGQWSPDHVALCGQRQREILEQAAVMLKPGGRMVYSTCTFSPEENEGTIQHFLDTHPEFSIEKGEGCQGLASGRPDWVKCGRPELSDTYRIWPHRLEGEGHYLALLRKSAAANADCKKVTKPVYRKDKITLKEYQTFCQETLLAGDLACREEVILFGDQLYLVPPQMPEFKGLKVVRPGLHMGTLKKNRFEPSHALALYLKKSQAAAWYDMDSKDEQTARYLRGESIEIHPEACSSGKKKGWILMNVDGYSIGWGKLVGSTVKNHYPKGLRKG